jgi:hypothetical protein
MRTQHSTTPKWVSVLQTIKANPTKVGDAKLQGYGDHMELVTMLAEPPNVKGPRRPRCTRGFT